MKRATIKDIAREAGTSHVTVSYYLNNKRKFSQETAQRIEAAIKKLGYVPNRVARRLVQKRSHTIGVVLPPAIPSDGHPHLLRDNPFYNEFLAGVQEKAWEYDDDVVITGMDSPEELSEWMLSYNFDGVIFFDSSIAASLRSWWEKHFFSFHTIFIGLEQREASLDAWVTIDEVSGIWEAVSYLFSLGHRGIAFATGDYHTSFVNAKRFESYQESMRRLKLFFDKEYVLIDEVSLEGGKRIGERLLSLVERKKVSAVVCSADILAVGIYKTFVRQGKQIAKDLSVIGFDDLFLATVLEPELTTIRQDVRKRGELCVKLIEDRYQGKLYSSIQLPVELVIRGSTAPYRS